MTDHGCKVCRTLEAHGGAWMEDELLARWRGDDGERLGYRRLAHWLNATLLERAMERAGLPTAGDEAASRYARLTGDDEAVADGVRDVLRSGGVPLDDLESAFVSYGVVRTHLLDCLEAELPTEERTNWEPRAISVSTMHAVERIQAAIRSRYRKGELEAGAPPEVQVTATVTCPACGATTTAEEAVETGSICACASDGGR